MVSPAPAVKATIRAGTAILQDTNARYLPILSPGCSASLMCQQSDGVHETQINGWGQAQAVAAALRPLLQ